MNRQAILKIDFHALNVLTRVHRLGSVSAAAETLGLSQSTVSFTLTRLREHFDDMLFTRQGAALVPTLRCDDIVRFARTVLTQLDELASGSAFDPAEDADKHHFRVSCNFYERHVMVPALVRRLYEAAPDAQLSVIHSGLHGLEQLTERDCDLLISPIADAAETLYRRRLLDDPFVCFMDRNSPLGRGTGTIPLAEYAAARHVAVIYEGGWTPYFVTILRSMGHDIVPRLSVPSYSAVDRIIAGTELLLTAPSRLASMFPANFTMRPAPFDVALQLYMYWTARTHESPPHRWLRGLAVAALAAA